MNRNTKYLGVPMKASRKRVRLSNDDSVESKSSVETTEKMALNECHLKNGVNTQEA